MPELETYLQVALVFATSQTQKEVHAGNRETHSEFRNRLDAWVAFKPLDIDVIRSIVDKFIKELNGQLAEKRILVELEESARTWLAENGFDPRYGARPMSRLIHERIRQPLANEILFGKLSQGGSVKVKEHEGTLELEF